jgi:hypothetical protein
VPAAHTWQIQAPPPDCSAVLTLTPSADAWIDQGSRTSNKGADSTLKVMSKSGSKALRAFVAFAIPSTLPAGCVVDSATLRMNASSNRGGRTLRAESVAAPWVENSITWNNQPGVTGSFATTASGPGWRQWNVTSQVTTMISNGAGFGFMIRDASENNDHEQQFVSREGAAQNRPQLIVTFVPAPAPDTVAPESTITTGPADGDQTSATVHFAGTDAVSPPAALTFQCSLDGAGWGGCTSPTTVAGLEAGTHTFSIRATDAAGNTDLSPATHTWNVSADVVPPTASLATTPPASTSATAASFGFASNEAGSTFQCSLDGASFAVCANPHPVAGLAVGVHTLDVYAVDLAGNSNPASAVRFTWTVIPFVDCGAPVTVTTNRDSWIDSGSTAQNKGTDSILKVMSKTGSNARALVAFTLPPVPAGCVVQSATLQMHAKSASNGRTLQVSAVTAAWSETVVTWANQPATSGPASTTTSGAGWREWLVTSQVTAMYESGGHHGFVVRDASENNDNEQQFDSREAGSNAPRLVVVFGSP